MLQRIIKENYIYNHKLLGKILLARRFWGRYLIIYAEYAKNKKFWFVYIDYYNSKKECINGRSTSVVKHLSNFDLTPWLQ